MIEKPNKDPKVEMEKAFKDTQRRRKGQDHIEEYEENLRRAIREYNR